MQTGLSRFVNERMGTASWVHRLGQRHAPSRDPIVYLACMLGFLLALAGGSGVLLLLEYWPDADRAHASIVHIVGRVPYGNLVRGVHYWSSHLLVMGLILLVVLHVVRRKYTPPRELVWLSSLTLLILGVGLAFTGSVLPWTHQAYLQARVSSELASHAPIVGHFLGTLLRGGREVSSWTLHHAFAFHVGVLPAAAALAVVAHAGLVRQASRIEHTAASPEPVGRVPKAATIPVYPDLTVRIAAACVFVLAVVVTLATLSRAPLGEPAVLTAPATQDALPPWYFLFLHSLLAAAPARLLGVSSADFIMAALTFVALLACALPFVDRRGSRVTRWSFAILLVLYMGLTAHALL